jgi:RHS repeat-associated protein
MPHDAMPLALAIDDSDEKLSNPHQPRGGNGLLAAFRATKQEISARVKRTGAKAILLAMVVAAAALGAPHKADAQCYDFAASGSSESVNITNLPAPVINGNEYTYTLNGLSGNSVTVTVGSTPYVLTAPPEFVIIINADPTVTTAQITVAGPAGTASVNSALYFDESGSDILPGGWPLTTFPPVSSWNIEAVLQGTINLATSFGGNLTSITDCAPPPPPPKTLGCDCAGQANVGAPINVATGNMFEEAVDYRTAGQNPLGFTRTYNSMEVVSNPTTFATMLGTNWRSNFDRYLNIASSSSVTVERADGQVVSFTLVGSTWTPDSDVDLKLTNTGSTWTLTDHNDNVESYTASGTKGTLTSITALNGYTQTLNYTGSQLTSVSDSYGRSLGFTYYSSGLLQTLTTPDGETFIYGFTPVSGGNTLTSVSYPTSPVTSLTYQYANTAFPFALTGILDEKGQQYATWTYDNTTGRALTSQHGTGTSTDNLTTVTPNSNGTVTVTNAFGVADTYAFTTLQGVPKVTQISRAATSTTAAATRSFTYDTNGFLNSETDWNGNSTTYTNNTNGNPTTINYAVNSSTVTYSVNIQYDPTFIHLPYIVTAPGVTSTYIRDGNGNPLNRTDLDTTTNTVPYSTNGQTRETQWTWSATGEEQSVQLPRTDKVVKTSFMYDGTGALTQIKDALGHLTKITAHTGGGLPQTIIDPNNVTTQLGYDLRLNLNTSIVDPSGSAFKTTWTHDAANELSAVTLPDNSQLNYGYDTAHRLTSITDLLGNSTTLTLDALGGATATNVKNTGGTVTLTHSAVFDALDRMTSDIGGVGQTTKYTYDPQSNVLTITPPSPSGVITQTPDALNRLATRTDPAPGGTTNFTYDPFNRVLSVEDANSNTTGYVYDGFGDRTQIASPDSGTSVFYFDPDKNLSKSVKPGSLTATYTYDALDRMLSVKYTGDTTLNVTNTWDQATGHGFGVGRLTSAVDQIGTLSLTYDERGNLTNELRTPTGLTALNTAWTYDAASNVASETYPDGNLVTNIRDSMGKVTSVTSKPSGASSATTIASGVTYEPLPEFAAQGAPPVTGLSFGNGVTGSYGYDLDYRPTTRTDIGTAPVQNLTYGYFANNSVQTITDAVNAANTQSMTYDTLDRLKTAASGTGGYGTYGFTWDPVSNIKTQVINGTTTTYHLVSGTNRLSGFVTGSTTETVTTSASGNITKLAIGSAAQLTLTYNKANELATSATASNTASYAFDEFGKRLKEVGSATSTSTFQYDDSNLRRSFSEAGNLLTDTDGAGNSRVDYIYLNGTPIGSYQASNNKFYFISTERLGTPAAATDSAQSLAWSATYQPFGNTTTGASGIVQNLRLPGQEYDLESTLNHNGFRDYAPTLSRYVQTDPIGLKGGMNTYQYVRGNPFKWTDKSGKGPEELLAIPLVLLGWWGTMVADSSYLSSLPPPSSPFTPYWTSPNTCSLSNPRGVPQYISGQEAYPYTPVPQGIQAPEGDVPDWPEKPSIPRWTGMGQSYPFPSWTGTALGH